MGIVEEAHNVKVLGAGEQTIVLAHGFGTDQSVWKHLVPHLVDDHRVILFDNMGAGPTNPDYFDFDRYASLEGYAYDVLALLEELQVESCVFVGHSVSSIIGAIASITRPDLFSKIIMISASPSTINDHRFSHHHHGVEPLSNIVVFDSSDSNEGVSVRRFSNQRFILLLPSSWRECSSRGEIEIGDRRSVMVSFSDLIVTVTAIQHSDGTTKSVIA